MIGYLKGKIVENGEGRILVAVGSESGAVGYSVAVPGSATYQFLHGGNSVELFIHTHVREDALELFGFASRMEKELFLTLLSVNGIGPKVGLSILSGAEPAEIIEAILVKDKDFLVRMPGVGKKTAERIVLELSDGVRKKVENGVFGDISAVTRKRPAGASAFERENRGVSAQSESGLIRDAKDALMGLGFREQEISSLLSRILAEADAPPRRAEDLVKTALKQLS